MDTELLKYLSTMGVGGIIAGLIFMFYRRDVRQYTELWRAQSEMLMEVVKDNTSAMTSNTEVVRAFHAKMSRYYKDPIFVDEERKEHAR